MASCVRAHRGGEETILSTFDGNPCRTWMSCDMESDRTRNVVLCHGRETETIGGDARCKVAPDREAETINN